jgi:lipid A 3-O-deacylase
VPSFEGAVGNLYDYAGVGAQLRIGYHLSDDFGPTVLTPVGVDPFVSGQFPTSASAPTPSSSPYFEAYVFGAAEGRWMVRNLFLDGNTFQSSAHIQKLPFVRDFDFGFLMRLGSFRLIWREIGRGKEFTPEYITHPFASVTLSYLKRL